jgi:hypothetical protein
MFDVVISVAGVIIDDENNGYTTTQVFRLDLEGNSQEVIDEFVAHIKELRGVVHVEQLVAKPV